MSNVSLPQKIEKLKVIVDLLFCVTYYIIIDHILARFIVIIYMYIFTRVYVGS